MTVGTKHDEIFIPVVALYSIFMVGMEKVFVFFQINFALFALELSFCPNTSRDQRPVFSVLNLIIFGLARQVLEMGAISLEEPIH